MTNTAELGKLGYERPRSAHQLANGRGGGHWTSGVVGDANKALSDSHLLDHLSPDLVPGDRLFLGFYRDEGAWKEEKRSAVAQLLVLSVRLPDREDHRDPGRVRFQIIDQYELGDAPKMLEHHAEADYERV